jgi:hypothetical protein
MAQANEAEEDAGKSDPDPVVVPLVGQTVVEDEGGDQCDHPQHGAKEDYAYVVCLHRFWIWTARWAHAAKAMCGSPSKTARAGGTSHPSPTA